MLTLVFLILITNLVDNTLAKLATQQHIYLNIPILWLITGLLFRCISSMQNNTVMDIFKNVQFGGFIIQFTFDNLQRVKHAHFGLLNSYY